MRMNKNTCADSSKVVLWENHALGNNTANGIIYI